MTKSLQDCIISALAESDNNSLSSLKNMAKKYGVDISQVLTISKRNKGRIIALKNSIKTQQPVETANSMGNEYMIIKEEPHSVVKNNDVEPKFVWTRTKEDQGKKKRFTDDEKLFIADKIEKAATAEIDGTRYITRFELSKLAEKYFVSIVSLISYMKEYTNVKMDHNFYACYSPSNKIPKEIVDRIINDLKTTSLTQYEIAELANVSQNTVSNVKKKNDINRPNEEDEEVKKKTKARRLKLQNNKNKASSNNKSSTTAVKKEEVVAVEEKVQDPIREPEKEIPAPTVNTVEVTTEEPVVDTIVEKAKTEIIEESYIKPGIPGMYTRSILHNKNINRITSASPVFECVLVDGRHSTPAVKGVFEDGLDKETMFDYDKQLQICKDFLKKYLRFDSEGRANKSVNLYCTGLQSPLVSFIKACEELKVNLCCLHYNNDTRKYNVQPYSVNKYPTYREVGVGVSAIYRTFGDYIYRYKCSTMKDIEQSTNCLYIIVCNENAHNPARKTSAAIVCKSIADYKELFINIVSTIINVKPEYFSVEVRKFNFDSEGNVIKNSLESYYETK